VSKEVVLWAFGSTMSASGRLKPGSRANPQT
jgi:hypothetical protein